MTAPSYDHRERESKPANAPRFARWLAGLRVPAEEREFAIGDLEEEFEAVILAVARGEMDKAAVAQFFRTYLGPS